MNSDAADGGPAATTPAPEVKAREAPGSGEEVKRQNDLIDGDAGPNREEGSDDAG